MALGSFEYMAPERFEGGAIDRRTDVYSLGCLLYECLTGQRPFSGEGGAPAPMFQHLNSPAPRASEVQASIPAGLDPVVIRAMAKRPEDRYARAGDLATPPGVSR